MNNVTHFRQMHQQNKMLHIGNVWNTQSALMFEKAGYQALATSSAAIADTLGYDDGEQMSFEALFQVVQSIVNKVSVPLSVDIEAGYSREVESVVHNIVRLAELGVVGINLEDSIVDQHNARGLVDAADFNHTIASIKSSLSDKQVDIFLNIRTDAFLIGLDSALEISVERAVLYEQAGADGLFFPCATDQGDIEALVNSTSLPVNIMAMPQLPDFSAIAELGVRRLSTGPFVYNKIKEAGNRCLEAMEEQQSFNAVFSGFN